MLRSFAVICLTAVVPACTMVPVTTQSALDRVDPLTADPAGFVLALDVPPGIGLREGAALIYLSAVRTDTSAQLAGAYELDAIEDEETGQLTFRVAPEDVDRLRSDQAKVADWERSAPDATSGSLSVSATGCLTGEPVPSDARVSAGLRIRDGGPFLTLLRNAPMADLLGGDIANATEATCP